MADHKELGRAKTRTQAKASRAKAARASGPTANATERMKGRINIAKTAKAFSLAKLSNMVKKSRSPAAIAFALGLDAIVNKKKAKKINAGPI